MNNAGIDNSRPESIKDIVEKYNEDKYEIPDFQRDITIWTSTQKKAYIKNIFNKVTPTSIVITKVRHNDEIRHYILDGLQRINALREFKKGKFKVKLSDMEGTVKGGLYCYKSVNMEDNEYLLDDQLKQYFDNYKLIILHSSSIMSYSEAIANFQAIQKGTPVSENTLLKSKECKINKLINKHIDEMDESKEFDEFKKEYQEDLYYRILIDACIYWNHPENAKSITDIPEKIKREIIEENLQVLFDNFKQFYDLLTIKMDNVRVTCILIEFVTAKKINNQVESQAKLNRIVKHVHKCSQEKDLYELEPETEYWLHLKRLYL